MPQPPGKSNNSVCVVSLFDHNTPFLWTQSYVLPWQEVGQGESVFEACVVTDVSRHHPIFSETPPWLLCSLVTFSRIQQPAMISMTMIPTLFPDMTPLMKTSKLMALVFSPPHLSFLFFFFNKIGINFPPVTTWLVEPWQKDGHTVCQFKHYQLQQLKYKLMRCVNQQDQWGRVCMCEKILQVLQM